jgi:hypothetical protein
MAIEGWQIGAGIAAVGVLITAYAHIVKPWWRARKLKQPCSAHFVIRPMGTINLGYVVQDDERHDVRTLVLPSHSVVEIEIGFRALLPFRDTEIIFGCDGNDETKPYASGWIESLSTDRLVYTPGVDAGHSLDIHKFYHRQKPMSRNVGTHYTNGLKLVTRATGTYRTYLSFLTDEIEGNVVFSMIVEDKPRTRMKCIRHRGCYVRPQRMTP